MTHDITLDGAGYMLAPGSYQRSQDGIAEGRTGRVTMQDFFGGQHRALQLERDRGWIGTGVGPALDGQGVAPWPRIVTSTLPGTSPIPSLATPIPAATINDHVFFALGGTLYRTAALDAANWATPVVAYTAPAGVTITGIAWYDDDLLLGLGGSADPVVVPYPGGSGASLLAGERAGNVISHAGFALWNHIGPGGPTAEIRMVTGTGVESRYLDARIARLATAGGRVWAATRTVLYSFSGRVRETLVPNPAWVTGSTEPTSIPALRWSGEWEPFFQHGTASDDDDYTFLIGFGGRLVTWLGRRVVEHMPTGDRAGWRDLGLGGRRCRGACIAGGILLVAIEATDGASEVWAWDGAGWWLLLRDATGATRWIWPTGLSGVGEHDALLFRDGSRTVDLVRLHPRSHTAHAFATSASYTTSLLDADARDRDKAWRKVGAVFASPETHGNAASTDAVSVSLEWSADAGATWQSAALRSITPAAPDARAFTLDAAIASDAAVGRWLMLRARWNSISDWAPVLTALWAEFETLDAPARRRRWQFAVTAHDDVVRRDGNRLDRDGRAVIADLWLAWEQGTTLPFRDIDDATERRVRIIGIREQVARPADAADWGDAVIQLTLVEV